MSVGDFNFLLMRNSLRIRFLKNVLSVYCNWLPYLSSWRYNCSTWAECDALIINYIKWICTNEFHKFFVRYMEECWYELTDELSVQCEHMVSTNVIIMVKIRLCGELVCKILDSNFNSVVQEELNYNDILVKSHSFPPNIHEQSIFQNHG